MFMKSEGSALRSMYTFFKDNAGIITQKGWVSSVLRSLIENKKKQAMCML